MPDFPAPIRWGILGCGDVCEVKSGPALYKTADSQLVGVMRRDEEKAADFARRHGAAFSTGDADELIARDDIAALYIAAPPGSHRELALKVARAGKPCLIEKPFCRSAREAEEVCEVFEAANLPLFVSFYRRGLERFRVVKGWLDDGEIGTLTGVSYRYLSPRANYDRGLPWRVQPEIAGAGLFYDLGSHLLDVFDFWFGPLQNARGTSANVATPQIEAEDTVSMSFLASGAPGAAIWNFAAPVREDKIEIWGDKGRIECSCFGGEPVKLWRGDELTERDGSLPPHVHSALVESIVGELLGRGQSLSTGRSALRTMRVMDAALGRI